MTGQELLMCLSYIDPKYIEESEQTGTHSENRNPAAQEDLSASDQGITVSVKQTIVDKWNACIILKIEGFALPEGVQPCFYGDPPLLTAMPNFGVLPVINSMTASS